MQLIHVFHVFLSLILIALFPSCGFTPAQSEKEAEKSEIKSTATGSYGAFSPKAFVEATTPWTVYRAVGPHSKSGFPCDKMGNGCTREKKYVIESVRSSHRTTSINIGVGTPIGEIVRDHRGTHKEIKIKALNNLIIARIDGTRASSRMGFDAAEADTLTRTNGLHGGSSYLGHVESKSAAWAVTSPFSYYYPEGNKSVFGMTVVEKFSPMNVVQNFFKNTPMQERMRAGTYWCESDSWMLNPNSLTSLFHNDNFDMNQCEGTKLLSSDTSHALTEKVASFFLNRQDSVVTLHQQGTSYEVKAQTEWFCPFDCDGSNYAIHFNAANPTIKIDSDRWNWASSSKFKIKIVRLDWDNDGFIGEEEDLRTIANRPEIYQDIVAIVVSEVNDFHGDGYRNGQWTQHSYIIFPPLTGNESYLPAKYKKDTLWMNAFQIKLFDSVLAMMPDQTQSSPELADIEEKLDELRVFKAMEMYPQYGTKVISTNLLFDILSEVDATTAVTWKSPGKNNASEGKIAWILSLLGPAQK